MHIISGIIRLGVAIVAFVFASVGLSQYFGGNEADMAKYEQLAAEGQTVTALLDSMYSETSVASVTLYDIDYHYEVNGEEYTGNMNIEDPDALTSPFVEVTYLPSDPSISSDDAPKALADARSDSEGKGDLWLGLAAVALGLFMAWRGVTTLRSGGQE